MTYTFFEDPGHGWLQVPIAELRTLNIRRDISTFSYRQGEYAYLEEDCDLGKFMKAKEAAGQPLDFSTFRRVFQDPTPIRDYKSM